MSAIARCPECGAGKRVEALAVVPYVGGQSTWGGCPAIRIDCTCGHSYRVEETQNPLTHGPTGRVTEAP